MMRLFLLLLLSANLYAQDQLTFDKYFIECEDRWVAFERNEEGSNVYGFIYIDPTAGLTFNHEGRFTKNPDKTYTLEKLEDTSMKVRLDQGDTKVALLPSSMYAALEVDSIPEWLKYYKEGEGTVERLYDWGFLYNGWNYCSKALEFLQQAHAIDPNYQGLAVELAFSYNCLDQFDKAAEVLKVALEQDPTNAYVNKEYIYTLIHLDEIAKAEARFHESVKLKIKDAYHAENCFNILGYYYKRQDVKNFNIWVKQLKKWPNDNDLIDQYVKAMKAELK